MRAQLVGNSPVWLRAMAELVDVAQSTAPAVLLHGETGTGKEAAARLVHELGHTRSGPFVIVHAGAIIETLSGSELFGHRKGAFTGADRDREGAIARANGGSLFLDEIGELKPGLQTELLRVLQDGTYNAVGDDRLRASRFRLIAATHRSLDEMVESVLFDPTFIIESQERHASFHRCASARAIFPCCFGTSSRRMSGAMCNSRLTIPFCVASSDCPIVETFESCGAWPKRSPPHTTERAAFASLTCRAARWRASRHARPAVPASWSGWLSKPFARESPSLNSLTRRRKLSSV